MAEYSGRVWDPPAAGHIHSLSTPRVMGRTISVARVALRHGAYLSSSVLVGCWLFLMELLAFTYLLVSHTSCVVEKREFSPR